MLADLGRNEEAIASYDRAIKFNPNDPDYYYKKACSCSLQHKIELCLDNLQKAIQINPKKYLEQAKSDSDFDNIRHDPRFQTLIQ